MCHSTQGQFQQQVRFLRQQFLQDGGLPFTDVLSAEAISQALVAIGIVLEGQDLLASGHTLGFSRPGPEPRSFLPCRRRPFDCTPDFARASLCSSETGAYCHARKRLPEEFVANVARQTGRSLDKSVNPAWLWKYRRVYVYDGSTVSMPDTAENQAAYPQPTTQKAGLGFPLARIAAVFSLACGAVVELGICRYAGKGQSELGMLRKLWDVFKPGDIMLADTYMCAWTEMVMLKERGVDCVCRMPARRRIDFRSGKRLGKNDHIVKWYKPKRPSSIDQRPMTRFPSF